MKKTKKTFMTDIQELKEGLIIFHREDVNHRNWYCRIKIPNEDRYKFKSLGTSDITEAKRKAFHHDADVTFRIEHKVPIFEKSFEQVAIEYSDFQKRVAVSGQITTERWKIVNSYITRHLIPYVGNVQITKVGAEKWDDYPRWRKEEGKNRPPEKKATGRRGKAAAIAVPASDDGEEPRGTPAKDGTIRQEMMTFRAIMKFAAKNRYIPTNQVPDGKLPMDRARREEFSPQEYRALYTYSRSEWVPAAANTVHVFYRQMTHNFVLIMANTGMRPPEARNLRWRDIHVRSTKDGRQFVFLNVRGKGKYRELVAPMTVADYLNKVREISKATKPDDFVFSTYKGKSSQTLYAALVEDLLVQSNLLYSSSGSRRSTYCFRHTYATFRLMHGTDVYFLAKQMGTSVQMIEKHYGHITPSKNADAILQGIPGWEADDSGESASGVNAGAAGAHAKPRARAKRDGKDLPPGRCSAKHRPASRSTRRR
jgi:integrase